MSEKQQDNLIDSLHRNGIKTVRTGFGDKFIYFLSHAYKQGIGAIVIISPLGGVTDKHYADASKAAGLGWRSELLSDASPEAFKGWFKPQLEALEKEGVRLTAMELGNEINNPHFNGDFTLPAPGEGRNMGYSDLKNPDDKDAAQVAKGFRKYVKVLAALKEVRDASDLNRHTPILSAGLADGGLPRHLGGNLNGVSVPGTIHYLRDNGLDSVVDAYGVHAYPSKNASRSVDERVASLEATTFAESKPDTKPSWLTEWNFDNPDLSCPNNDDKRKQLVDVERKALKKFAQQGRLDAAIWFSWSGAGWAGAQDGSSIYRCGSLTSAGKSALSPL
jgi:hypothetical protein